MIGRALRGRTLSAYRDERIFTQLHRPADVLVMMRRRGVLATLLSICLLLGASVTAGARAHGAACVLPHGTLIAADRQAAVYTIRVHLVEHFKETPYQPAVEVHNIRQTRGCVVGRKKSRLLGWLSGKL